MISESSQVPIKGALLIRSITGLSLVLFGLFVVPSVIYSWKINQTALNLIRSFAADTHRFPWINLEWWQSLCKPQASNSISESEENGWRQHSRQESRLTALSLLARGDCATATRDLEQIRDEFSPYSPEQIVLGYLYSMQGVWERAAETFPLTDIPHSLWAIRNYWADVSLRAAESVFRAKEGEDAGAQFWLNVAEELAAHQSWRGSQALASYFGQSNRPIERFEEFRRALTFTTSDAAYAVADEYFQYMAAYIDQNGSFDNNLIKMLTVIKPPNGSQWIEHLSLPPKPEWELDYAWNEHWQLIGVNIDRVTLVLGPLVEATFFWTYTAMPGATPVLLADHRIVYNLMPDAGFEWLPASQHIRPFGYLPRLYAEPFPLPYQIVRSGDNQYFCLANTEDSPNTGVVTIWKEFASGQTDIKILQGGMFRTIEGGKAYMGWRWYSSKDKQVHFAHVIQGEQAFDWKRTARVWEVPVGTDQVAFHLLQFQNEGRACFDNLFAFELKLPEIAVP